MTRDISKLRLRPGTVDDVPVVLRLLDGAIAWLVSKGNSSQWGTEPWSQNPTRIKQATEFAESWGMWLAVTSREEQDQNEASDSTGEQQGAGGSGSDGQTDAEKKKQQGDGEEWVVGVLAVGGPMPYIEPAPEPELYVKLLLTDRAWASYGVGALLLDKARELAREAGVGLLRLDCFAGNDQKLVKYYESQGFTRTEAFEIENWPGMVLAQRLDGV